MKKKIIRGENNINNSTLERWRGGGPKEQNRYSKVLTMRRPESK